MLPRCNLSLVVLYVISTRDDLQFVSPYLSINRPWELINVMRYAFDLSPSYLWTVLISVVQYQVGNNLVNFSRIIIDTESRYMLILFRTTRGSKPLSGKVETCLHIFVELTQRTRPVASCSGFRGSWLESSCHHTPSMRRTTIVVLHSTGCFHLSLFSWLVVDKLLLVLLLLRCKVLPMGTLICHDRPAWVIRPNLLPRKIMDELDYYGSFISFAGIA
jgi:hypothetical protein